MTKKKSERWQSLRKIADQYEQTAALSLGQSQGNLTQQQQRLEELLHFRQEYSQQFMQSGAQGMDGATLQVGAVAAVERVKNPIQLARRILTSEHNMLVGRGADAWADQSGLPLIEPAELIVPREQARFEYHAKYGPPTLSTAFDRPDGTVGAVAIDREGNLAAATSTGGTLFKPVGRVGDSPLPGCGYQRPCRSSGRGGRPG